MIIGIDGNEANVEQRVGISEYAYELLSQFKKYRVSSPSVLSSGSKDIEYQVYLKDEPRKDLPKESEYWKYRVITPKKLWTQVRLTLDLYLHRPKPDVFFTPTHYAPRFSPVPTVISIMDLSFLFYPELFKKNDLYQLKNWTNYSARNAKRILTISKFSKDAIMKEYGLPDERVVVTYPGLKETFRMSSQVITMNRIKSKYGISDKYILFVGTLQPRKNITRLIEAYSLVKPADTDLVVIGKKGWLYEEILDAPKKYGVEQSVKFLDFVPDHDLPSFYQHAVCFVLPSLYEGFGLPVLEAMRYHCPVIISNTSSLPEVGGDAALYVKPDDVSDIAEKIQKVLESEKLRKEMVEKGKKQAARFSWERAAKETLQVLTDVAQGK